jgi:hypothetical protein
MEELTLVTIEAVSYAEFVKKVKEDVQKRDMGSLIFLKAVANSAIYKDKKNNNIFVFENMPDERLFPHGINRYHNTKIFTIVEPVD